MAPGDVVLLQDAVKTLADQNERAHTEIFGVLRDISGKLDTHLGEADARKLACGERHEMVEKKQKEQDQAIRALDSKFSPIREKVLTACGAVGVLVMMWEVASRAWPLIEHSLKVGVK